MLGGEQEAEAVLRVRDRRNGHEFWSLVKATATFDAQGNVRHAINLFRDITGQKEAERAAHRKATQMSHLYAITAALSGTTDVAAIAEALAEQTLTAFQASRGAVVLRSHDGAALETVAWRGHQQGAEDELRLATGDTLILYTDGVTEERGPEGAFGEEGLTAVLQGSAAATASEIVDRIEGAVLSHGSGEPRDDIAILAVRATG